MTRRLLFLCTGNYYRSRFAELLFNNRAACAGLAWTADSRGLAVERGIYNVGPIAGVVIERLQTRGIDPGREFRFPMQLSGSDLEQADRVIALYEPEHRPLVEERFRKWASRVEYWNVPDLNEATSRDALAIVEAQVQSLVKKLSNGHGAQPGDVIGDSGL